MLLIVKTVTVNNIADESDDYDDEDDDDEDGSQLLDETLPRASRFDQNQMA